MNGKTVLVIDDDKDLLAAVARVLRNAGYGVETTTNSLSVAERLKTNAPHLVITDIMMPNRDGVEIIGDVRRARRGARVLAMSGRARLGSLDLLGMARELGADDSILKPFTPDELLEKVGALLDSAQAR